MPETLSVIVPMYNERDALGPLTARLRPVLDGLGMQYEVLCIDDGSSDGTAAALRDLRTSWPEVSVLRLRRNAGHQAALTAGLDHARGDWVVSLDADLQDPPEVIVDMLALARDRGVDVVYGVRDDRSSDSAFKRISAGLYYRAMSRAAGVAVPRHAGDFRLMSGAAVREVRSLSERSRVYRLLIPYMGFRSAPLSYPRARRVAGSSKYPLPKMVRLAADSYASFTTAPLRFATWLGVLGFLLCSSFAVVSLVAYVTGNTLPGWTSVALVLGFVGALQFLVLGMIGEYVARLYTEMQARPRYFLEPEQRDQGRAGPGLTERPQSAP